MPSTGVDPLLAPRGAAEKPGMRFAWDRGLPAGGPLAIAGAVVAVVALALPWVTPGVAEDPAVRGFEDPLMWVVGRVLIAIAVIVLTLRVFKVEHERETLRVVYVGAAVFMVVRALHWLLVTALAEEIVIPDVAVIPAQAPMWGLFVSFAATGLLGAAALAQHRAPATEEAAEPTESSAAASEVDVAGAPTVGAPVAVQTLDPDLAAFAAPGPVAPAPPVPVLTSAQPVAPTPVVTPAQPVAATPAAAPASARPQPDAEADAGQRRSVAPPGFA